MNNKHGSGLIECLMAIVVLSLGSLCIYSAVGGLLKLQNEESNFNVLRLIDNELPLILEFSEGRDGVYLLDENTGEIVELIGSLPEINDGVLDRLWRLEHSSSGGVCLYYAEPENKNKWQLLLDTQILIREAKLPVGETL